MVPKNIIPIIIIGPTASGKTALAHAVADLFAQKNTTCELVNLDAFQIYQQMNIGTAKPTPEEIRNYHYHAVDLVSVDANMDANVLGEQLRNICQAIIQRGNIPIAVGGSGLYLRAFLHGLDALPPRDENCRRQIRDTAAQQGWPWCHNWLQQVDPVRAAEIHPNDQVRIERALEIFLITGKPMSSMRSKTQTLHAQNTLFPCFVVHIQPEIENLKQRIIERTNQLFANGWVQEVESLLAAHGDNLANYHAMNAIGYRQILSSILFKLQNASELQQLASNVATLTWQYAKRQLTWNAKEKQDYVLRQDISNQDAEKLLENYFSFQT